MERRNGPIPLMRAIPTNPNQNQLNRVAKYKAHQPSVRIEVNCYHINERPVTATNTMYLNGVTATTTTTYMEKYRVSSSVERYSVPILAWVDSSPQNLKQAIAAVASDHVCTHLTYDQSYLVLPEQQNMILDLKALLYNHHSNRDTHCEVTTHYHGPYDSLTNESTILGPDLSDGTAKPTVASFQVPELVVNNPDSFRHTLSRICWFNPLSATVGLVLLGLWFPAAIAYRTLFFSLRYHSLKTLYFGVPDWCEEIKNGTHGTNVETDN